MSDCTHHWIIAAAEGKQSTGECRLCGAVKTFHNSEGVVPHPYRQIRRMRSNWEKQWSDDHHMAMRQAGLV